MQEKRTMKPLPIFLALATALPLAAAPSLHAQSRMGTEASSNPVMSAVRMTLSRYARNLEASAEEMPAAKYSFAPTKEQMTFGHLMSHVAGANEFSCSSISGMPRPAAKVPGENAPKDSLVAAVKESFEYCTKALAGVKDSQLGGMVHFFGNREVSRAAVAVEIASDLSDHYSQAAIYLRLNGMLPPTARRRGM
jgi:hypothetical protein